MGYLLIILFFLPSALLSIELLRFLFTGTRLYGKRLSRTLEVVGMLLFPILYLWLVDEKTNDCCSDSAAFSPNHRLTIYILIALCIISFFYSAYKKTIASPVVEVLINTMLLFGFVFNIFIAIQVANFFSLIGNIPVGILFIFRLIENHQLFLVFNETAFPVPANSFQKNALKILTAKPILKFPLFFILCLPVLVITASLLLFFGQRPDAIVRAFTDTYKHGFSQLDYMCDNVECGGHFLCSVAANGHRKIVHPIRYGERNGNKIICNRQLLIANAFEEVLEEHIPRVHQVIRANYNKVGNTIHRHYHLFNNKIVADCIYFLIKPLEFFFLLVIYTMDQRPENRISKQYLSKPDRQALGRELLQKH